MTIVIVYYTLYMKPKTIYNVYESKFQSNNGSIRDHET
jgi:hypothetical protein